MSAGFDDRISPDAPAQLLGGWTPTETGLSPARPIQLRWTHHTRSTTLDNTSPTTWINYGAGYDPEDRLNWYGTGSAPPGSGTPILQAGYDADGLRVKKTTASGTTYFLYDGGDPVEELTYSGGVTTVTALNTFGAQGLVSRWQSGAGNSTFYQYDPMGNVAHRSDIAHNLGLAHK